MFFGVIDISLRNFIDFNKFIVYCVLCFSFVFEVLNLFLFVKKINVLSI